MSNYDMATNLLTLSTQSWLDGLAFTHLNKGEDAVEPAQEDAAIPPMFTGVAYIAGRKTTGLNSDATKRWVRCFLGSATAEENAGPPPDPLPANEEWYDKYTTVGDIHITRA